MRPKAPGRAIDTVLYCLAAVIIGVGVAGVVDTISHPGIPSTTRTGSPDTSLFSQVTDPFAGVHRLHILILGADDMAEAQGRSDAIMVLFLNPERKRAALLSIPRDLRTEIPGHGLDKINHAYHFGGVELTRETVERLLGLTIDYYAKADFQAFEKIVDTLGGVEIDVPKRMYKKTYYGTINLQPGPQHLDGKGALQFVRYRNDSDFKRAERQQQLLRAIIQQKLRLTNLPRLIKVAGVLSKAIDTDMEWSAVAALVTILKDLDPSEIMTAVVPGDSCYINGISYVELRERRFFEMMDEIDDHISQSGGHPITVEVLNGFGQPGAAAAAGELLTKAGFEVTTTGNADCFTYERTVIEYSHKSVGQANEAKDILQVNSAELVEKRSTDSWEAPEIVVVLGQDFKDTGGAVQ